MAMKISVSFKDHEKDLYDYARTKRDISAYVKDLIEEEMQKSTKKSKNNNSFSNGYDF